MPTIEIKAIDTLFFRDGRPFEMGEDNWAEGIFPPSTSVFIGALRSAYYTKFIEKIDLLNTNNDPTQGLKIKAYYLKKGNEFFIPAPLDFVKKKNEKDNKLYPLKLLANSQRIYLNHRLSHIPYIEENVETAGNSFMSLNSFHRYYLSGSLNSFNYHKLDSFVQIETKIGVGLDNFTRSSQEGKLFRVGLNRLKEKFNNKKNQFSDTTSFVIDYNLDFIPKILKLGAENKTTSISEIALPNSPDFTTEQLRSKYFKIILLTPAIFENGWNPNLESILSEEGIKIELISAFVGKQNHIGGWDIVKKSPKKMYKAVPGGSVYYYKITNDKTLNEVKNALADVLFLSKDGIDTGLYRIALLDYENLIVEL